MHIGVPTFGGASVLSRSPREKFLTVDMNLAWFPVPRASIDTLKLTP